jgi:hypothetical protein
MNLVVEDAGGKREVARKYARKAHLVRTKHFLKHPTWILEGSQLKNQGMP